MAFKTTWIRSDWSLSISLTSAPFSLCSLGWRAAAVIAPGFQRLSILSLCSTNFLNWYLLSSQAGPPVGDHFRLLVSIPQSVGCLAGFQTFHLAHLDSSCQAYLWLRGVAVWFPDQPSNAQITLKLIHGNVSLSNLTHTVEHQKWEIIAMQYMCTHHVNTNHLFIRPYARNMRSSWCCLLR